jgi:hypothetical protein
MPFSALGTGVAPVDDTPGGHLLDLAFTGTGVGGTSHFVPEPDSVTLLVSGGDRPAPARTAQDPEVVAGVSGRKE